MMHVCSHTIALWPGLALLLWTTTMTNGVAATPTDAEFTPNSNCQLGPQERPPPSPAQDTTNEFDILPENTVCTGTQDIILTCVPRSSAPVYWEYWTKTVRCRSDGSMTGGNSTLRLPCDSYDAQCFAVIQNEVVPSPVVHITKDIEGEEETRYCTEGEFNSVTFYRHAPVEEVMSTRWFVGGEECPLKFISSNGLRLDLPCMPENDLEDVSCEVEFRGGIVNRTVGWIQVNKSNSNQPVGEEVNEINGVTLTKSTTIGPQEPNTKRTIQLSPVELGIAIAVIFTAFLVILVSAITVTCWITIRCMRRNDSKKQTMQLTLSS